MKLAKAIEIGKQNGQKTVGLCIHWVFTHEQENMPYEIFLKEVKELMDDFVKSGRNNSDEV